MGLEYGLLVLVDSVGTLSIDSLFYAWFIGFEIGFEIGFDSRSL